MKITTDKRLWLLATVLALAIGVVAYKASEPHLSNHRRLSHFPDVIVWAWERPENLTFIDPTQTGVAFLAKTIRLDGAVVIQRPRLQPLQLPPTPTLIAVVRIEVDRRQPAALSDDQLKTITTSIADVAKLPDVTMVQIDFDALVSERDFYRRLIVEVRRKLPSSCLLSITALASWCDGDNWLKDLPIDEAVPMFFRMGPEKSRFASRLETGSNFLTEPCANAAGVSTDELVRWPRDRRVYLFSPTPWTKESFNNAMEARTK